MNEKNTLFDFLNQILYKKDKLEYDKKIAPAYMLSMFLSHDNNLIDIVNKINKYQFNISDKIVYDYYYDKIPKGKRYLKWTKKREEEKNTKENILKISNELGLSKREVILNIDVFKKTRFTKISKNDNLNGNILNKIFFNGE